MLHRTVRIVLPIFVFLASVYLLIHTVLIQAQPSTFLLSDHAVTGEDPLAAPQLAAAAAGNVAHVVWDEATGTNENEDLFYRQLPFGSTQNLSDRDITEGGISFVAIKSAPNDDACAVWNEVSVAAEGTNLYFWRQADGETIELTDNNLSSEHPEDVQFVCLDSEAHVIWQEDEELFYWQESTQVTQVLSNPAEHIGDVIYANLIEKQGTAYVAWSEWIGNSSTGIFHTFYWNSTTDTVLDLGSGTPEDLYFFVDDNETSHLIWVKNINNPTTDRCVFYWNSQSATAVNISQNPTNCETHLLVAELDENQGIHATWVHDPSSAFTDEIVYWNTQLSTPSVITTTNPVYDYSKLVVNQNGTAFVAWANYLSVQEDLFYWNSSTETIKNVSDPVDGAGNLGGEFQWEIDDTGDVHLLWTEEDCSSCVAKTWIFYHRVNDGNTVRLINSLGNGGQVSNTILRVSSPAKAHIAWTERISEVTGETMILYWDSDSQNVQVVGNVSNNSHDLQMAITEPGTPHLAWLEWPSGSNGSEKENVYFWNQAEGISELTDEAATEGVANNLLFLENGKGTYYALWSEKANPGEGYDTFGAWEEILLPNKVYLPVVVRE